MFSWLTLGILLIVIEAIFEIYLHLRQIRFTRNLTTPSKTYNSEITKESFEKSKSYQIAVSRFEIVKCAVLVLPNIISALFIFQIWKISNIRFEFLHSIFFVFIHNAIEYVFRLPINYYKTFVIEKEFGFNKSTRKLFITDFIKSFLVETLINGIMYSVMGVIFNIAGNKFIYIAYVFILFFILFMQIIYPILLLPLFIKLTPLEEGEVKDAITKLVNDCNLKVSGIYKTDDSKRTSKQNAFAYGLFKWHGIAIADTVLEKASIKEICAIIAHEIGHLKHHHLLKLGLVINQIPIALILFSISAIMKSDKIFADFGFDSKPFIIGIQIMMYLTLPITKMLQLPINIIIRSFEFQADEFAVRKNLEIDNALINLSQDNKMAIEQDPIYTAFNMNHPTLEQRVERISQIRKSLKTD